jgi:hypothetical protein
MPSPARPTVRKYAAALGAAAVLGTAALLAGSPAQASGRPIQETDVTSQPAYKHGQPAVAVNPRNPNNLVFTSTVFQPSPGLLPAGGCFLAYSNNGGKTWTQVAWPLGSRPLCGESNLAVDSRGTFYILNNQVSGDLATDLTNRVVVSRSTDGGRTWTGPVTTPLLLSGAPTLRVDAATGKVYAVGGAKWEYPSAVSVSSDHGQTWSTPQVIPGPMPCVEVAPGITPCGYPGREIAVYDGILVSAAQEAGGNVTFYASRDDGKAWTATTVTSSKGTAVPAGTGDLVPTPALGAADDPVPWVSADPTHRGRFAVMVPRGSDLEVYVTSDSGKTWTGPAVIDAANADRPWFDFGTDGVLGVMWRTTTGNAYSAVSFDHGHSFSAPLQVNAVTEPAGQYGPPGDRWSDITVTGGYAYITWADGRNGAPLDGIFAKVPLSLYQHSSS